jgi:hypothetical protein
MQISEKDLHTMGMYAFVTCVLTHRLVPAEASAFFSVYISHCLSLKTAFKSVKL